jgi:hypothetical protein
MNTNPTGALHIDTFVTSLEIKRRREFFLASKTQNTLIEVYISKELVPYQTMESPMDTFPVLPWDDNIGRYQPAFRLKLCDVNLISLNNPKIQPEWYLFDEFKHAAAYVGTEELTALPIWVPKNPAFNSPKR